MEQTPKQPDNFKRDVQHFMQVLIARNYNNLGKWSNEVQQYNYELIQEIDKIFQDNANTESQQLSEREQEKESSLKYFEELSLTIGNLKKENEEQKSLIKDLAETHLDSWRTEMPEATHIIEQLDSIIERAKRLTE